MVLAQPAPERCHPHPEPGGQRLGRLVWGLRPAEPHPHGEGSLQRTAADFTRLSPFLPSCADRTGRPEARGRGARHFPPRPSCRNQESGFPQNGETLPWAWVPRAAQRLRHFSRGRCPAVFQLHFEVELIFPPPRHAEQAGGLGAGRGAERRTGAQSMPVCLPHETRPWPPSQKAFKCPNPSIARRTGDPRTTGALGSCSLAVGLALAKWPRVQISQQSWPREFQRDYFFFFFPLFLGKIPQ